jgi:hypothetical protein
MIKHCYMLLVMAQKTEAQGYALIMVRMSTELKKKLEELAKADGRKVSSMARRVLEEWADTVIAEASK